MRDQTCGLHTLSRRRSQDAYKMYSCNTMKLRVSTNTYWLCGRFEKTKVCRPS